MLPPSNVPREKQRLRYLVVVALLSIIIGLLYQRYEVSPEGLIYMILSTGLVTASFIDLEHRIIPDSINFFLGFTGIFYIFMGFTVSKMDGLLGFFAGGGVLLAIGLLSLWVLKKEGMGGGDIKLAAVCGLYLGAEKTICSFFVTSYLALVIILVLFIAGKLKKGQYIPFGPFLSAGVIIVLLYYEDIIYYFYRLVLGFRI